MTAAWSFGLHPAQKTSVKFRRFWFLCCSFCSLCVKSLLEKKLRAVMYSSSDSWHPLWRSAAIVFGAEPDSGIVCCSCGLWWDGRDLSLLPPPAGCPSLTFSWNPTSCWGDWWWGKGCTQLLLGLLFQSSWGFFCQVFKENAKKSPCFGYLGIRNKEVMALWKSTLSYRCLTLPSLGGWCRGVCFCLLSSLLWQLTQPDGGTQERFLQIKQGCKFRVEGALIDLNLFL